VNRKDATRTGDLHCKGVRSRGSNAAQLVRRGKFKRKKKGEQGGGGRTGLKKGAAWMGRRSSLLGEHVAVGDKGKRELDGGGRGGRSKKPSAVEGSLRSLVAQTKRSRIQAMGKGRAGN